MKARQNKIGRDAEQERMRWVRFVIVLAGVVVLMGGWMGEAAGVVVVDFAGVSGGDFPTYSEDGFTLATNVGCVRISDTYGQNNAAQPSFGFGQGSLDSHVMVTKDDSLLFDVVSIDLLEATGVPEAFGITMMGIKPDASTISQTFTLDGISGAETFWLSLDFVELCALEIWEDTDNSFDTEIVQIDNVTFDISPEPVTGLLVLLGGIGILRKPGGKKAAG